MKKLALLSVSLLYTLVSLAQLFYEERIELELKDGYESEVIYESSKGVFVMEATSEEKIGDQYQLKYDLYNSDLELEKTEKVMIPGKLRFNELYYNDEYIYNFYTRKDEFAIVSVRMEDLDINVTEGTLPMKANFRGMKVMGNTAYFEATKKKAEILYKVDLETGQATAIPLIVNNYDPKKVFVENYQLLEKTNELLIFLNVRLSKKEYETYLMMVNADGKAEKPFQLSQNDGNTISSVSACRISPTELVYTGTYSKNSVESEGLFFAKVTDGEVDFIQYFNFLDLNDFLSYLPERKQEKIEKKKEKKEKKGKEFSIDYLIADHDIIVLSDGYLFLGEAYYPTYRTESYTTYSNGVATTHYRTVFDGYRYTHAVLAKYGKDGALEWDICFEMYPNYKPFYVKRFIAISDQTENTIGMVFTSGNAIISKIVDFDGEVVSDEEWDLMETGNEEDKARWTSSNIDYWFENYFIAYGSQKIKDKSDKSKRKVYFVNKIGF
ncbi:MAG: hypothetical protein C0592_03015 [Marinilabiliales bacterium]|nr:MAG: hypothetical protein C0592_03015 [Marinilabiliales bacterium]